MRRITIDDDDDSNDDYSKMLDDISPTELSRNKSHI